MMYDNYMKKSEYETRMFRLLRKLEADYAEHRLTEREFEILLGLLIEKQFSENIKWYISHIAPPRKRSRGIGFVNYEMKYTHAR